MSVRKAEHHLGATYPHDLSAKIHLGETREGVPAVRVDLQDYISGDPVYTDPVLLRRMGAEFLQAATYLERKAEA